MQVRVLPGVLPAADAMPDNAPQFDDAGRLIAPGFGDVYFAAEDGLAETTHVFLEGNRLAERFASMSPGDCLTIGETGFGTGLNFLATWRLFERHAAADAQLEFVSVEGFPLGGETMRRALSPWPVLERQREALIEQWGPIWPGVHRFSFAGGRVRLSVLVGEAAEALGRLRAGVDAWFLDGFAPSRNPAMWSDAVFEAVARCSNAHSTLATYTAAGFVRRGLQAVGFEIEKRPGFGPKREMMAGRFVRATDPSAPRNAKSAAATVIGGSLAGAFAARALAERGLSIVVIERQTRRDAELPALIPRHAVLQPKLSDASDDNGRWLRDGFSAAQRRLMGDPTLRRSAAWRGCGSFHAAHDERAERRLRRFVEQFGETGLCRWIDADATEDLLGVALPVGGVAIEVGGTLRPAGLCAGLLSHDRIEVRDGVVAERLSSHGSGWRVATDSGETLDSEIVVVANALSAAAFEQTRHLPLRPVRGQVTVLSGDEVIGGLSRLRRPIFYGGYALPPIDGRQSLGASFCPGDATLDWRDAEHHVVCDRLSLLLPDQAQALRKLAEPAGWVGLRTTTPTHRCYAESIGEGLYVSLGHGSHGIASAARAAEHLAEPIARSVG
ncbi:MAG: tRNA (5-methylaminomethyl-2-thiouridine)(34)-methyltransferase MnmD [Phycisphaeraceae bacterium]